MEKQFETYEDNDTMEQEPEQLMELDIDEDKETIDRADQYFNFEIGDESTHGESENYDPLLEKFSERLFEIASQDDQSRTYEIDPNVDNELDRFVDDLQREMFGEWISNAWKLAKKTFFK
jgi:hypothetical protein